MTKDDCRSRCKDWRCAYRCCHRPVLSPDQKKLYDDMADVIEKNFGELIARRSDGALIGPFNAWLHFPQFGGAL